MRPAAPTRVVAVDQAARVMRERRARYPRVRPDCDEGYMSIH